MNGYKKFLMALVLACGITILANQPKICRANMARKRRFS